jgi:hypothetical protein
MSGQDVTLAQRVSRMAADRAIELEHAGGGAVT